MINMWSTLCENAVWSQQADEDLRFSQCQWQPFQIVCDHNRAAGIWIPDHTTPVVLGW